MSIPRPHFVAGLVFGDLTILSEQPMVRNASGQTKRAVLARCACGDERDYLLYNLKNGNTTSCGCHRRDVLSSGRAKFKSERAPQAWTTEGAEAFIWLKGRKVLVDSSDVPLVENHRWRMDGSGYVETTGPVRWMHRIILGLDNADDREADHIHGIRWDNRRSQLRVATSAQNTWNSKTPFTNTSGHKGVSSRRGKWQAFISANGTKYHLGTFDAFSAAVSARKEAAARLHGQFARFE